MKLKGFFVVAAAASFMFAASQNSFAGDNSPGYKLIKANGCLACHAVDQNKIGPSYKLVAEINKKEYGKDAIKEIEKAIEKGSKGKYKKYGIAAVMPPYGYLGKQKIETIAKWIMSLAK